MRGSRFYHGDMGVTMAFPTGWIVDNQPARVLAYPQGKEAIMDMRRSAPPQGVEPKEFLGRMLQGVPTSNGEPLEANGLHGYTAIVRSTKLPWGNQGPARVAVVYFNNLAYIFTGATQQADRAQQPRTRSSSRA